MREDSCRDEVVEECVAQVLEGVLGMERLGAKYSMPARMWRHGIHAFLQHRLPESLEYMLAFIYIAYMMMALLYETVPTFEDTLYV